MELRYLRYFAEVANNLSFVKAADSLHVSQPTISRQIQELADEIGTPLFTRDGNRTALTQAGEYFKIEVDHILEHLEAAARTAKILGGGNARTIRIGCVNFFIETVVLPLLEGYRELCPDVRIEILAMSTESQLKALRSGAIDVGFVRELGRDEKVNFDFLFLERLSLVFPRAAYEGDDVKECLERLSAYHFVALAASVSPVLAERLLSACSEYGIRPEAKLESSDAHSILSIVSAGLGWSIVPKLCLRDIPAAAVGAIDLPQTIDIGLCYLKDTRIEECVRFIQLAKDRHALEASRYSK